MTQAVVIVFAAALAIGFVWLGWRQGGRAALRLWLPLLVSSALLVASAKLARTFGASLGVAAAVAAGVWIVSYVVTAIFTSRWKRRIKAVRKKAKEEGREPSPLGVTDRIAGSLFGLLHAALVCVSVGFLGGMISFWITMSTFRGSHTRLPAWVEPVGEASAGLASVADRAFFRYMPPGLREEWAEVVACVNLMSAPRWKLAALGDRMGVRQLLDVPEMRTALEDEEVIRLLDRINHGHFWALEEAKDNEKIKAVLNTPEVQKFIRGLRPSRMADELDKIPASEEEKWRQ